ncbi:MAG TPA: hypothetical protein VE860_21835 [Chthoniobacterales bacterium]|nr:hypothetical protein [Chthoniobacterales bacterium]
MKRADLHGASWAHRGGEIPAIHIIVVVVSPNTLQALKEAGLSGKVLGFSDTSMLRFG